MGLLDNKWIFAWSSLNYGEHKFYECHARAVSNYDIWIDTCERKIKALLVRDNDQHDSRSLRC